MAQPDSDFGDMIGRQKFTPSATAAIGFADVLVLEACGLLGHRLKLISSQLEVSELTLLVFGPPSSLFQTTAAVNTG